MSRVTAKICGLSTPGTLDAAIKHGASHVGLVFYPPSPRNVAVDQTRALASRVPEHVSLVGVFVDPDDDLIDHALNTAELDVLQLHATSPERVSHLRRWTRAETWAVVAVKARADLDQAGKYRGAAHKILYDAKTPDGALPGGMGLRFDWGLLDGFEHPLPWALSGGLSAQNVADAATRTGATLVDVSSGVESAPGVKDVDKIAAFLKAVALL